MANVKRAKKCCVGKMYNIICNISALKYLKTTSTLLSFFLLLCELNFLLFFNRRLHVGLGKLLS